MMRRRLVSLALAVSLSPGLAWAGDKTGSSKPPAGKAGLPKPAPRGESTSESSKKIPPFFGMFGTAEMIAKLGFRSKPGTFIEYALDSTKPGAGDNHGMRIAEVGPPQPGGRWIEMTATDSSISGQGLRIFARGEKNGNVERIVARIAGMPPMEFPLESLGADGGAGLMNTTSNATGPAKIVGHETVTTPVGKFATDHWVVDLGSEHQMEFWVTTDEKIPFTGVVKMVTENGTGVVAKFGTDATPLIQVPPRSE